MEPGEAHELNEKVTIRVASEKDPDCSDSEWEEGSYNTFVRQKRLPSFVRYKNMRVVTPTPIHSTETSLTSVTLDRGGGGGGGGGGRLSTGKLPQNRRRKSSGVLPPKRPVSPRYSTDQQQSQTMKERLTEKLSTSSFGSFSIPNGLSSFMEYEQETYKDLGIDLEDARLTVETASDTDRKLSSASAAGILITVEPEGKSVTFTRERVSVSSSTTTSGQTEDELGGGLELSHVPITEEEDEGTLESGGASIVKTKRQRQRSNHKHRSKCKIS